MTFSVHWTLNFWATDFVPSFSDRRVEWFSEERLLLRTSIQESLLFMLEKLFSLPCYAEKLAIEVENNVVLT